MPRMAEHLLSHSGGGKEAFIAEVVSAAFRNAAGSEAASFPWQPGLTRNLPSDISELSHTCE